MPAVPLLHEAIQVRAVAPISDEDQCIAVLRNRRLVLVCSRAHGRSQIAHGPMAGPVTLSDIDIAISEAARPVRPEIQMSRAIDSRKQLFIWRIHRLRQSFGRPPTMYTVPRDIPDVEVFVFGVLARRDEIKALTVGREKWIRFDDACMRGERGRCRCRPASRLTSRHHDAPAPEVPVSGDEVQLTSTRRESRR